MVEGSLTRHLAFRDQHAIAVGSGDLFDTGNNRGEEGVGQVRRDHRDGVGPLLAQVAGGFIDDIAGLLDRLEHLSACTFADTLRVAQGPADRRGRYACDTGDILDGGDFSSHLSSPSFRSCLCTNIGHCAQNPVFSLTSGIHVPANSSAIVNI